MPKILKGASASTLAAATIVTGLTFGPAATASATGEPTSSSSAPADGTKFRLVTADKDGSFWGQTAAGSLNVKNYETRALAEAESAILSTTAVDGSFYAQFTDGPLKGKCLSDSGSLVHTLGQSGECGTPKTLFTLDTSGRLVSTSSSAYVLAAPKTLSTGTWLEIRSTGSAARFEGLNAGVSAAVEHVDHEKRTALLVGTGKPSSWVEITGVQGRVWVNNLGQWIATVENLKYGVNTVHVENWVNGIKDSEKDLSISLNAADLVAYYELPTRVTDDLVIAGQGEPGADITIHSSDGDTLTSTTTDPATGEFRASVPAPNAAGKVTFGVHQTHNGADLGWDWVDFNYGAAVSVTSPADNSEHAEGMVTFTGFGQPTAKVEIREEGKPATIASGTVGADGSWAIKEVHLDGTGHKLLISQTSAGNNSTSTKITLLAGDNGVSKPLAISGPTGGSTIVDKDGKVVLTGTGTPGQRVTLQGANGGRVIGTPTVDANGTWTHTTWLSEAAFVIDATLRTDTKTVSFSVRKSDGVTTPLRVTSPSTGSTAGGSGRLDWTGTGKPGETVKIVNQYGVTKATATVQSNSTWSVTTYDLMANTYDFTVSETSTNRSVKVTAIVVK